MTALFLALGKYRQLLTLLAVLVAAASIYVWWQAAERDRASLISAADNICEASGAPFRTEVVDGEVRDLPKKRWGVACLAEVRRLQAVESQVTTASLDALLADLAEREGKEAVDAALAARMSKQAADAVARMEAADAAVENDQIGPGWVCALNDLGGLHGDGC